MSNFGVGDVIKISYFNVLHHYRKIFTFTGLCINYSALHRSFTVQNYYGSEFVRIHFTLGAPYIVAIDILRTYSLKKHLARMHYQKKMHFIARSAEPRTVVGGYEDPTDFIYRIPLSKTERKRLRRKFRI